MTYAEEMEAKRKWTGDQMARAGVPEEYQTMIGKFLETMWFYELNDSLDVETSAKIVNTFAELAKGHVLVPDEPTGTWVQAKPGMLVVRDRVRVRVDAFTGPDGPVHNGREGDIVAIRHGDVYVRYDGMTGGDSIRHKPDVLEKRVR